MSRIDTGRAIYQKGAPEGLPKRFSTAEKAYYSWMHTNCTCVLTGYPFEMEIAHTGGPNEGKGAAMKAWLSTCLPLRQKLHHYEEKHRAEFWHNAGFPNREYIAYALRLFETYQANERPDDILADMQMQANREYLAHILSGQP